LWHSFCSSWSSCLNRSLHELVFGCSSRSVFESARCSLPVSSNHRWTNSTLTWTSLEPVEKWRYKCGFLIELVSKIRHLFVMYFYYSSESWWYSELMLNECWQLSQLWNRKPALNGSFSNPVFRRARLFICDLSVFFRCSFCSLRWLLLANLLPLLGFSFLTPTVVCFCFGWYWWWYVLLMNEGF